MMRRQPWISSATNLVITLLLASFLITVECEEQKVWTKEEKIAWIKQRESSTNSNESEGFISSEF